MDMHMCIHMHGHTLSLLYIYIYTTCICKGSHIIDYHVFTTNYYVHYLK